MMTKHQFLLIKLAEEASEVAQIALKAAQFGAEEIQPVQPPRTNAQRIQIELHDLYTVVLELEEACVLPQWYEVDSAQHRFNKQAKLEHYLKNSRELGQVQPPGGRIDLLHAIIKVMLRQELNQFEPDNPSDLMKLLESLLETIERSVV